MAQTLQIILLVSEPVAVINNIEYMFHKVLVPEKDRSLLRFLWWKNHDTSCKISMNEMNVHVFGGTSSPSCCNYALKKTALDNESNYCPDVVLTLKRNFYVYDLLKSLKDVSTAVKLIHDVSKMCSDGGFHLTKFINNELQFLSSIPTEDRRRGVKNMNISDEVDLPTEKALSICWNIEKATFGLKTNLCEKPLTRCGMLYMVSKIYDHLGFAAPFLLKVKRILQVLCKSTYSWDEAGSDDYIKDWNKWKRELKLLERLEINRCFKPSKFGKMIDCCLHHFSDASQDGYGQVSYLRLVDQKSMIHCGLVMAKSRVIPIKFVYIPRLELAAAALSIKVSMML